MLRPIGAVLRNGTALLRFKLLQIGYLRVHRGTFVTTKRVLLASVSF